MNYEDKLKKLIDKINEEFKLNLSYEETYEDANLMLLDNIIDPNDNDAMRFINAIGFSTKLKKLYITKNQLHINQKIIDLAYSKIIKLDLKEFIISELRAKFDNLIKFMLETIEVYKKINQ